jgi:hypothetical protein
MKIELFDSTEKDLLNGFKFYERQSKCIPCKTLSNEMFTP